MQRSRDRPPCRRFYGDHQPLFQGQNGLLEATMRDITSQLRDAVLIDYMHFRRAVQSCDYRRLLVKLR